MLLRVLLFIATRHIFHNSRKEVFLFKEIISMQNDHVVLEVDKLASTFRFRTEVKRSTDSYTDSGGVSSPSYSNWPLYTFRQNRRSVPGRTENRWQVRSFREFGSEAAHINFVDHTRFQILYGIGKIQYFFSNDFNRSFRKDRRRQLLACGRTNVSLEMRL